jgi:hypothetical protein
MAEMEGIERNSDWILVFWIWGNFWRRGTDVNTPKLGSRGAGNCSGGILDFYAELRRKLDWGNLFWGFLMVLIGTPRGTIEEGGQLVLF